MLSIYKDIAGLDMSYAEFKQLCRESWKKDNNYLKINIFKTKLEKYYICNEASEDYILFIPETNPS